MRVNVMGMPPFQRSTHKKASDFQALFHIQARNSFVSPHLNHQRVELEVRQRRFSGITFAGHHLC
jgi:hypothetical protein